MHPAGDGVDATLKEEQHEAEQPKGTVAQKAGDAPAQEVPHAANDPEAHATDVAQHIAPDDEQPDQTQAASEVDQVAAAEVERAQEVAAADTTSSDRAPAADDEQHEDKVPEEAAGSLDTDAATQQQMQPEDGLGAHGLADATTAEDQLAQSGAKAVAVQTGADTAAAEE